MSKEFSMAGADRLEQRQDVSTETCPHSDIRCPSKNVREGRTVPRWFYRHDIAVSLSCQPALIAFNNIGLNFPRRTIHSIWRVYIKDYIGLKFSKTVIIRFVTLNLANNQKKRRREMRKGENLNIWEKCNRQHIIFGVRVFKKLYTD